VCILFLPVRTPNKFWEKVCAAPPVSNYGSAQLQT
jgi:hypothetical protein